MKTICSRTLTSLGLVALLIGANGCLTQSAIQYARGRPGEAWVNDDFGNRALPLEPVDMAWTTNGFEFGGSPGNPPAKPQPTYYLLLPVSVPADIATLPFQIIGLAVYQFEFDGEIPATAASSTKL